MISPNGQNTDGSGIESTILLRLPRRTTTIHTLKIMLGKLKQLGMELIHYYRVRKILLRQQN